MARIRSALESHGFYPRVLGGVLTGIAAALAIEAGRRPEGLVGLGAGGAIAINVLGGSTVAAWLRSADAEGLPKSGRALLWGVAVTVLSIGALETAGASAQRLRRASAPL